MEDGSPITAVLRRREFTRALLVSVALLAVTLWPVLRSPPRDSFPHSTYPMFSENRSPIANIDLVIGFDAQGQRVTLSPQIIAGTEEVIVAGSLVRRSVRSGSTATEDLCRDAARRLARVADSPVVEVEVRTDRHDAVAWFGGQKTPLDTTVHASCPVAP